MNFFKLTNVTNFPASLEKFPMGCNHTELPDPFLKNLFSSVLTFDDNTRKPYNDNLGLFRALALNLHENEKFEETSKIFSVFLKNLVGLILQTFEVFERKILQQWMIVQADISLCDIEIVDLCTIGELVRRSVVQYSNAIRLIR